MSYYDDLGLSRSATDEEIRDRYRELALVLRPDRGGDTAAFQRLGEAYGTLRDPAARRAYDATLGPVAPDRAPAPDVAPSGPVTPGLTLVDDIPPYARNRWIIEERELDPAQARRQARDRRREQADRRRLRNFAVGFVSAAIGGLIGQVTSKPVVVAIIFFFIGAYVLMPLVDFVRRGRR